MFHLERDVTYNTVFDWELLEVMAKGKSDQEFREALRARKLTHIYVDWEQVERHRKPGGYGFTDFVDRGRFAQWVAAGLLEPPLYFQEHAWRRGLPGLGANQELYRIK